MPEPINPPGDVVFHLFFHAVPCPVRIITIPIHGRTKNLPAPVQPVTCSLYKHKGEVPLTFYRFGRIIRLFSHHAYNENTPKR
jgi:hypothetical protein